MEKEDFLKEHVGLKGKIHHNKMHHEDHSTRKVMGFDKHGDLSFNESPKEWIEILSTHCKIEDIHETQIDKQKIQNNIKKLLKKHVGDNTFDWSNGFSYAMEELIKKLRLKL